MGYVLADIIRTSIYLCTAFICAVTDLAWRRIFSNVLIFGTLSIFLLHIFSFPSADRESLFCMIFFLIILFLFFTKRLIGGGDLKLYAFTVFAMPGRTGLMILFFSLVIAAAWCLFKLIGGSLAGRNITFILKDGVPMAIFIFTAALIILISERSRTWIG